MKTSVVQIEHISVDELVSLLAGKQQQQEEAGDFASIVPWLTKEQAATALRGSTAFVDSLVSSASLRPYFPYKNRPATVRFLTKDVLKLRAAGKTGRK